MKRRKQSKVVRAYAKCERCRWDTASNGAMGAAARHTDDSGHPTRVEQTIAVRFQP